MKSISPISCTIISLLALFFFGKNNAVAQPYRWYVNASSTATQFGFDWQNPFTDLQQALDFAQSGDEIWVAAGIYKPTNDADRDKSFRLKSGVKFYGSFAGTENAPAERSISANPTILSGDIGQPGDSTDNSRTIMYLDHPDSATLISGFVFEKGMATGSDSLANNSPDVCGGAIFMNVYLDSAAVAIEDCVFRKNIAQRDGGAFYMNTQSYSNSLPTFKRCQFIQNKSGALGGAIALRGGNFLDTGVEISHCAFIDNYATLRSADIDYAKGYGNEVFEIFDCRFEGMVVAQTGYNSNSIYLNQGNSGKAIFHLNRDTFLYHDAGFGNLIYMTGSFIPTFNEIDLTVDNSVFEIQNPMYEVVFAISYPQTPVFMRFDNNSFKKMHLWHGIAAGTDLDSIIIRNNLFESNNGLTTSNSNTLNIIEGNRFFNNGGLTLSNGAVRNNLFINTPIVQIAPAQNRKCEFSNNLFVGDGDFPDVSFLSSGGEVIFNNNIFSMANGKLPINAVASKLIFNNNISNCNPPAGLPASAQVEINGQTTTDPQFLAPDTLDFHLQPCSPAINAGTNLPWQNDPNPTDFDGNPRITDGLVDIGPFETQPLGVPFIEKIRAACDSLLGGNVGFLMDGGCPPFQFFWKKGTATGTDTAHLAPGIYQFTLTDSRGKTATATVDILGSDIAAAIAGDPVFCADEPGVLLEATIAGGQNPIVFEWNTGETGLFLQNAGEGLFVFTATDAAGCTGTDSFLVEKSPETVGQFTVNDATGPTAPDGSIILNLISGQPPFLFAWSNGDSTGNPQKLASGPYSITITNADGCTVSYDFVVGFTIKTDGAAAGDGPGFYPNPASSRLFVEWGGIDLLEIFDQKGGLVLSKKRSAGAENFGLEGLEDGAYRAVFSKNGAEKLAKPLIVRRY